MRRSSTSRTRFLYAVGLMLLSGTTATVVSADDTHNLAKAAQNPISNMINLPFQNNTDFDYGPQEKTRNTLNIQPVWPIEVSDNWNVITRTIFPVVSLPATTPGTSRTNGLGDTTFTAFLSPRDSAAVTWGVGPVALIPTATKDELGNDEWGLGLSAVVLTMPGHWVIGSLFSNLWSVGNSDGTDINLFTWQYFINYNMDHGWYLTTAPINTANWEAPSSERWTVPIGGGIGRLVKFGKQPINMSVQAYYNVEKPTFGADWTLRTQVQFLFPK